MGRIKTTQIKRISQKLFKEHKDEFKPDFVKNKKVVSDLIDTPSKKLRNIVAGYVTRLSKNQEK
jgi:small subunit ribosomal protein S17e